MLTRRLLLAGSTTALAAPRVARAATPILSAAVEQRKLRIVGGVYRLGDGRVEITVQ